MSETKHIDRIMKRVYGRLQEDFGEILEILVRRNLGFDMGAETSLTMCVGQIMTCFEQYLVKFGTTK